MRATPSRTTPRDERSGPLRALETRRARARNAARARQSLDAARQTTAPDGGKDSSAGALAGQRRALPPYIYHPDGTFMRCWGFALLFFVVWNVLLVPFKVCFMDGFGIQKSVVVMLVIDYVGDLVFLADILLSARYVAYFEGDQLIHARRSATARCRSSRTRRSC